MNALRGLGLTRAYERNSAAGLVVAAQQSMAQYTPNTPGNPPMGSAVNVKLDDTPPNTPPTGANPLRGAPARQGTPAPDPASPAEREGERAKSMITTPVIVGGLILLVVVGYFLAK